jgi:hypothetical protein
MASHYHGRHGTLAAVAGYPHITVPAGFVAAAGGNFIPRQPGRPLIRFAYAYDKPRTIEPREVLPTPELA